MFFCGYFVFFMGLFLMDAFHFSFARTKEKRNKKKIRRLHFFAYSSTFFR